MKVFCMPIVIMLIVQAAGAQQTATLASTGWDRLPTLTPGQRLAVQLRDGKPETARGHYVAADANSLTIRTITNPEWRLPRDTVRKVSKPGRPWVIVVSTAAATGLSAGLLCAAVGSTVAAKGSHCTTAGWVVIPAAGGGLGALIGYFAGGKGSTIYKSAAR